MSVFVSYSPNSTELGKRLERELCARNLEGMSYNLQSRAGGQPNTTEFLRRELNKFDWAIVLWEKQYAEDTWLQEEVFAMQMVEQQRKKGFIIPVCVDEFPLHAKLRNKNEVLYFENPTDRFEEIVARVPRADQVFVVIAIGDPELDSAFHTVVQPTIESFGLRVVRVDQPHDSEPITNEILRYIDSSPIVYCDLTNERPNVYFETGYALALNRNIILARREGAKVHFDLDQRKAIIYDTPLDLREKLIDRFEAILSAKQAN